MKEVYVDYIIFDINMLGGLVKLVIDIVDLIIESEIFVIVYVNKCVLLVGVYIVL